MQLTGSCFFSNESYILFSSKEFKCLLNAPSSTQNGFKPHISNDFDMSLFSEYFTLASLNDEDIKSINISLVIVTSSPGLMSLFD